MQVPIVENVLKLNDEMAAINRQSLSTRGIYTLNIIGSPGSGKTTLLEKTLARLHDKYRMAVLVGDLTTSRDGDRLAKWCPNVVQINTGKGCHLDANQIRQAMARVDLDNLDLLIIENVGNLICPVGFDLGQDVKVGLFSTTEGDDKPAKHPYLVYEASVLLLNKWDLSPYVDFRYDVFVSDIRKLNPNVPLLKVSASKDQIDPWLEWLHAAIAAKRAAKSTATMVKV